MSHLITIPPRLDMEAAVKLHHDWAEIISSHAEIIIECSHLQQLSTAGLQLLISFKKSLEMCGKKCVMRNISQNINNDLHVLGVAEYFNNVGI